MLKNENTTNASAATTAQPGVYYVSDSRDGGKRPVSRRYVLEQIGGNLLGKLNESGSLSCGTTIYSTN